MNEISDITIKSRTSVSVTGVDAIINFSDTEAVFTTALGILAVSGTELYIDGFDKENKTVTVKGTVSAVFYPGGKKDNRSFFKKLFS